MIKQNFPTGKMKVSYLEVLESESSYILRETAAQFRNPYILFSGGKDSIALVHLALNAFWPAKIPFKLLHIDTGHNFEETILFRDWIVKKYNLDLKIFYVQDDIDAGEAYESNESTPSRNQAQSVTLLRAIKELKIDAALGGARRDEEKARAKERFFSHRNEDGKWQPENQRAEVGYLLNGMGTNGGHFRIFPLSNWTEIDVWLYFKKLSLALPSLYFSHSRPIINRNGMLIAHCDYVTLNSGEEPFVKNVRCRTIGDMTCTGLVLSDAKTIEDVIIELMNNKSSERGNRIDDQYSDSSMEDRKVNGYF